MNARSSAEVLPPDVPVYRSAAEARTASGSRPPMTKKHGPAAPTPVFKPDKRLTVWGIFKNALVGCTAFRDQWVIVHRRELSTA